MANSNRTVLMSLAFLIGSLLMFLKRKEIAETINTPILKAKEKSINNTEHRSVKNAFWGSIRHFKPHEFDSRDLPDSGLLMNKTYVTFLDEVRQFYGSPISISSGYRTKEHNSSIRNSNGQQFSATNSPHMYGIASDVPTSNLAETKKLLHAMLHVRNAKFPDLKLGLGVYGSSSRPNGYFIHSDIRIHRSPLAQRDTFWTGNSYPKGGYRKLSSSEINSFKQIFNNGKK